MDKGPFVMNFMGVIVLIAYCRQTKEEFSHLSLKIVFSKIKKYK